MKKSILLAGILALSLMFASCCSKADVGQDISGDEVETIEEEMSQMVALEKDECFANY